MAGNTEAVSAFIEGAPPGELTDVVNDIKSLTNKQPNLLRSAAPAFKKYNEAQFAIVKLPSGSRDVMISEYNSLGNNRYYDVESSTSFEFDHETQRASAAQSHAVDSKHTEMIQSLLKAFATHASEHFAASTSSIFPTSSDSALAICLVANKYSPSNFWNGRWRSVYILSPSSSSLEGTIRVDVHYYEDGNVRLTTSKRVQISTSSGASATEIVRQIALAEKKYQEELNRGFNALSEGAFKGLRRQLPVTRQKVEWEKIGSYRASRDLPGGKR